MKAARFYGRRDVRVTDIPKPKPKPDQALVAIEWCGICGSDLHEYLQGPLAIPRTKPHPITGDTMPVTLGHEFCGRIVSAPSNSHLTPGQAVMVDPRIYCKLCSRCSTTSTNACYNWGFLGLSGAGGGLSETVAVDPAMCYPLPESVPLELAALIEPLAVAWHAANLIEIDDFGGRFVLILGGGPVGIALVFVLKARGAKKIFVSEPTARRAEQNAQLVDAVFNPMKEDVGEECRKLTAGEGVDIVFDCAGIQQGLQDGMNALRHKGTYVNIAAWEKPMTIPMRELMLREITMKASMAYNDTDFKETVDAFVQGKFRGVEKMVTSRIHLDDVATKGFEELITNKDNHIKILVTPKQDRLAGAS